VNVCVKTGKYSFPEKIMAKTKSTIPIYHGRRWPVGLSNASKRLGVSIGHLHHVLTGKRTSPRVVSEYQALCAELAGKGAA
jgi:hypothetical protein